MEERKSYFDCTYGERFKVEVVSALINILSLFLLYPLAYCYKMKILTRHIVIDNERLEFNGSWTFLIKKWFIYLLLSVFTLGIFAFTIPNRFYNYRIKNTFLHQDTGTYKTFTNEEEIKPIFDYVKVDEYSDIYPLIKTSRNGFFGKNIARLFLDILFLILTFGTGFLFAPLGYYFKKSYMINNTVLEGKTIKIKMQIFTYFLTNIGNIILIILTLGLYLFKAINNYDNLMLEHTHFLEDYND